MAGRCREGGRGAGVKKRDKEKRSVVKEDVRNRKIVCTVIIVIAAPP